MRTPLFIFAAFCGIAAAISTLAAEPIPPPKLSLSWEELRDHCLNYRNVPSAARLEPEVRCRTREKKLVLAALDHLPYSSPRTVEAWVSTFKYEVPVTEAKESRPPQATCLKYKEVEDIYNLSAVLSCEELLQIEKLSEFCSTRIAKAVEQNRITPERKETGVLIDTCGSGKPETLQ